MNKLKRVSEHLKVDSIKLKKLGVYDGYVNIDSEVYINPKLLAETNIDEFKNSEDKILSHFAKTIRLLKLSNVKEVDNSYWKMALKHFDFPEPNGVGLGSAISSINGNGLTGKTAESALLKLKDIVDTGLDDPYMFQLLSLIQENIGVDRISDMIANIIYDDLLEYTQNVLNKLEVDDTELFPYKGKKYRTKKRENGKNLILVPEEILSDIPPLLTLADLQSVIDENNKAKEVVHEMFGEANKLVTKMSREVVEELILKDDIAKETLKLSRENNATSYDFEIDPNGIHNPVERMQYVFLQSPNDLISKISHQKPLFNIVGDLIERFKFIIENKGLNEELYVVDENKKNGKKPRKEITSHRLFISILESLSEIYEVDYTYESKSGNGQIDFRFTRGKEKVLVEFKLNNGSKLVHGYMTQLTEYMEREECEKAYYVIMKVKDNNNSIEKFDTEVKVRDQFKKVIVVDGILKPSPSKL